MPQRSSAKKPTDAKPPARGSRRPRGAPRKLLLAAGRELFARQDYRSTTTREIADAAGVTEHLLFRNFGSKAGLFREALVLPFTEFVDDFGHTWDSLVPEQTDEEEFARRFVGQLYDVLVDHQGLLLTLMAAHTLSEDELAETGIADIRRALDVAQPDRRGGHANPRHALQQSGPAGPLDGCHDRRHGSTSIHVLRNQATASTSHRRRARPSDPARIPAPKGLDAGVLTQVSARVQNE